MESGDDSLIEHKFFGIILLKSQRKDEYTKNMIREIIEQLNAPIIDVSKIRSIATSGVLEIAPSLRSLCWKLFLQYLPLESKEWEAFIDKKRNEYNELKEKYMNSIKQQKKSKAKFDHPLSINSDSNWMDYFQENMLGNIIDKDLKRTRNEVPFFTAKSKANKSETNLEVIKRILIIFAKKHPEIKYVQGLNEILALIYYCFAQDENPYFYLELEGDVFFCFENLMGQIGDMYISEKDFTETGIKSRINYLIYLLEQIDYELYANLYHLNVDITVFTFRWYTVFFTQEFSIVASMRIFDYILLQSNRFHYLTVLCLCALKIKRQELLKKDYAEIMNSLQTFSDNDVLLMISKTVDVERDLDNNQNKIDYISFVHSNKNVPY